jgi:integrator complex subunit 1
MKSLHRKSRKDQESLIPCPAPQKIPAITVVLQDSRLFYSLLACLKMSDVTDSSVEAGTPRFKRNRAYSFGGVDADNTPASKMMKIQHSPQKKLASRSTVDHQPELPSIPLAVFAATILYSAFQHVDHWPAPLVQAYAEDSFGPRQWVDDKRCSLLVQNLELAHNGQKAVADEASLVQAARVARYYESLPADKHVNDVPSWPTTLASQSHDRQRSMSLDSVGALAAAPSDSDSGDEEGCFIEVSSGRLAKAGNGGGDDSSSSGEDEEMVVMNTPLEEVSSSRRSSLDSETATSNPMSSFPGAPRNSLNSESATPRLNPLSSFPGATRFLNLTRIRRRYVGLNLDHAHKAISSSLSDRLDLKFKQNSKLLLALPSFVCLPAVRRLTTRHLERWLQSPALSGPARALFAATVQQMRNVDPPLPDDVETIDNILGMRLKANQLNMHIENVTEIVKRIPNVTVSRQIFLRILREQIPPMESGNTSSPTELMQMMAAVYGALPSTLSCEGLAMAFLTLLAERTEGGESSFVARREHQQEVKTIRSLVRSVASTLGSGFDGCGLIASLLSFDVNTESWSLEDEDDKARLLYECATLLVPLPFKEDSRHKSQRQVQHRHLDSRSDEDIASLRSKLKRARKLMLDWCCNEYAPRWQEMNDKQKAHHELVKKCLKRGEQADEPMGAGPPDFNSVLGGEETANSPECLDTMRCVLFMVDAESTELQEFLFPGEPSEMKDPALFEYQYRIQQCCEYGSDLDDEMLWILLKSAALPNGGIDSSMALPLIEVLFERCNKDRAATLQLTDPNLVWALYRLVEYFPPPPRSLAQDNGAEITNGKSSENGASTGKIQNGTYIRR